MVDLDCWRQGGEAIGTWGAEDPEILCSHQLLLLQNMGLRLKILLGIIVRCVRQRL